MFQLAAIAASAAIGVGKALAGSVAESTAKSTLGTGTPSHATTKAKKTATDFEKMFLENSLDKMTQSEGTDGPLGENGTGGGVYRSMLTKEYANTIVQSGGVGVADSVFREMMKMQGATHVGS